MDKRRKIGKANEKSKNRKSKKAKDEKVKKKGDRKGGRGAPGPRGALGFVTCTFGPSSTSICGSDAVVFITRTF